MELFVKLMVTSVADFSVTNLETPISIMDLTSRMKVIFRELMRLESQLFWIFKRTLIIEFRESTLII